MQDVRTQEVLTEDPSVTGATSSATAILHVLIPRCSAASSGFCVWCLSVLCRPCSGTVKALSVVSVSVNKARKHLSLKLSNQEMHPGKDAFPKQAPGGVNRHT